MKRILDFDIEKTLENVIRGNLKEIKLFFILFAVNIFIYGQKIFFVSLAPDDFSRMYNGGGELASWLGRWMAGIINQNLFTGPMHIQPYFNGVIGIFSFTLAGFLTSKIFKRTRTFEIFITTLLISATPMVANNLYFNTNIAVWLSTALGIIGVFLAQKKEKVLKAIGFLFFVFSIGCYQTMIQIAIAIAMIQAVIGIMESKNQNDLKKEFLSFFFLIAFILLAFCCSSLINFLYIKFYHLEVSDRLAIATQGGGFSVYYKRLSTMFHSHYGLAHYATPLLSLYRFMALLSFVGSVFMVFKSSHQRQIKVILTMLLLLMFVLIPLVINLPNITGNSIPIRAHYTIGWFVACFFVIQSIVFKKIFRSISLIAATSIIVLSASYINIYFDGAVRQTNADITRANQIVNRIRMNENYSGEPIKFRIVGTKIFPTLGWNYDHQALDKSWSKYSLFEKFTDLNFEYMDDTQFKKVEAQIFQEGNLIDSYPGKNSIFVNGDQVVLFLDTTEINNTIALSQIQKRKPNAHSYFDLYLNKDQLIYVRSTCTENDLVHPFYLHIYPLDSVDLPKDQKFIASYFPFNGMSKNGQCVFTQKLPNFAIRKINTGQFSNDYNEKEKKPYTIYWKSTVEIK